MISDIVKDINTTRRNNKNVWYQGQITIHDDVKYAAIVRFKMFNTWIQVWKLTIYDKRKLGNLYSHKTDSPMDMKVKEFTNWLTERLEQDYKQVKKVIIDGDSNG